MQHVAKISCRNGVKGEYWEEKGEFRREKCNMLQKSLVKMALRVNIGKKEANLEEICSICYIISCIITLISVESLLKLTLK